MARKSKHYLQANRVSEAQAIYSISGDDRARALAATRLQLAIGPLVRDSSILELDALARRLEGLSRQSPGETAKRPTVVDDQASYQVTRLDAKGQFGAAGLRYDARQSGPTDLANSSGSEAGLIGLLSEGRNYTAAQEIALELENQARIFQERRALLDGALSATDAAALLGTSRQTPHDRVKSGTMLAVAERGQLKFPQWQFDPDGPNGVVSGLPAVIRALEISDLAKARWLTLPNPTLDGQTPLDALKNGQTSRVIDAARAVGVS